MVDSFFSKKQSSFETKRIITKAVGKSGNFDIVKIIEIADIDDTDNPYVQYF